LKFVKGFDFILEHGDSIFMPAGYWHYMTYLNGSFSVSYRKLSPNIKHSLEGLLYLGLMMPLDKLLNKVIGESWLKTKNNIAQKRANLVLNKFALTT
jgi:ribosomal protein L16 Arg81 hydroxylase